MTITPARNRANENLHDQLDRLHLWIEQVPVEHRAHVAARLDQLFVLLGELVDAPTEDQP